MTLRSRFYAKVQMPSEPGGCWRWTAAIGAQGYGVIGLGTREAGTDTAHRVSWRLHNGTLPPADIDHRCGNRWCVNPEHLRAATRSENNQNQHRLRIDNTSGYRGVSQVAATGRFAARVGRRHLGTFGTAEEAAEAAKAVRLALFTHNEKGRAA